MYVQTLEGALAVNSSIVFVEISSIWQQTHTRVQSKLQYVELLSCIDLIVF